MEEQPNSFLTYNIKGEKDLVKFKQEKEEEKNVEEAEQNCGADQETWDD